jgi:hypothetical protein
MAKPYLAMCTMYRDHAADLAEWIEFHRLVGAERFFLYDNGSTDNHREVLAPYSAEELVEVHDWPANPGLVPAFGDCIRRHADDARWIAFIDIDEFLFSPTGQPVADVLRDFEDAPGVGVNRVPFGTSGHATRPGGLVTESYLRRAVHLGNAIKTIANPALAEQCMGAHHFRYRDGLIAVDELHRPLDPAVRRGDRPSSTGAAVTETFSAERLRVNHYVTKSLQELEAKLALPRPDSGDSREPKHKEWMLRRLDAQHDEVILQYLPALRAALGARLAGAER